MAGLRITAAGAAMVLGMAVAATPATAQFFLQHRDYSGTPVQGDEPGIMQTMAGATADERRAALVWTMRSALNVAALQCQFEPTLLTVGNYNALLLDHKDELKGAWDTLNKYFARNTKTIRAGQAALDQFGTRTYSSFATVASQYGFCRTASSIGRDGLFAPRGKLGDVAVARMRELRNSLVPYGEQRFARYIGYTNVTLPRLDPICWNKKGEWVVKKCGVIAWGADATQIAAAG